MKASLKQLELGWKVGTFETADVLLDTH